MSGHSMSLTGHVRLGLDDGNLERDEDMFAQALQIDESLSQNLLGWNSVRLYAKMYLGLERMWHRVATELYIGIPHDDVT